MRRVQHCMALVMALPWLIVSMNASGAASETYDVVIVGGGIAGLTAGYLLRDHHVLILEKEQEVGGRALSGHHAGLWYGKGAEYIGEPESPLKEMIEALGLKLRAIPSPADVIFRDGTFYYGESGKARMLAERSSLRELNRFAATVLKTYAAYEDLPDFETGSEIARLDRITIGQWFAEQAFPAGYRDVYNVAFRGLFGANMDEVSAMGALPELAFDFEGFEALEEDDLENVYRQGGEATGMYTFDRGIAELPLALGKHLADRVRRGIEVVQVERAGEEFVVTGESEAGRRERFTAEAVILATPAPVTLEIAGAILSRRQQELLGGIDYAPYLTVALFSDQPIFRQGFDLALPDGGFCTDLYDATWTQRWHARDRSGSGPWIASMYAAPASLADSKMLTLDDKEVIDRVHRQLEAIFPGAAAKIRGYEITRFALGYPVMLPGAYGRLRELHDTVGNGLYLAGDYMIYPTFEAAAVSGQLAAEQVIDWLED